MGALPAETLPFILIGLAAIGAWLVGYENPAFFRRLFRRIAGITPGQYRRKFRLPDFVADAQPQPGQ